MSLQKGWTPLICASWKGHNQTVQLLLAAGANRDIVDHVSYILLPHILCNLGCSPWIILRLIVLATSVCICLYQTLCEK